MMAIETAPSFVERRRAGGNGRTGRRVKRSPHAGTDRRSASAAQGRRATELRPARFVRARFFASSDHARREKIRLEMRARRPGTTRSTREALAAMARHARDTAEALARLGL